MLFTLFNRPYKKALFKRLSGFSPGADIPCGGRTELAFTMAMFMVMGRLAKMDGRVTEDEIQYANGIMKLMGLNSESRTQAIGFYEYGKHPGAEIFNSVGMMVKAIDQRSALAKLFMQIQCRAACLKGELRLKDKMLLRDVAEKLGYNKAEFQSMCSEEKVQSPAKPIKARSFLQNAYRVLQLEPSVADGEIRRAYLRMMSRNHPDKLASNNLSEESLRQAQEDSMAIRSAYETVCGFRKIRA
ncbi:MAG: co-chaperone DjlA [SAR86 cluster bacterium]|uniref:Co-chaperone DjlA n=1 Tax=SAR86 cluster bacterium TaxID=2030880 RepID=A0A2A5AU56_9GAMM|nr:MAG: co-chaperone DjlA [SAR86 cluster bacterium]